MSQEQNQNFLEFDGLDQLFDEGQEPFSAPQESMAPLAAKPRDLSFFRHIPVKVTLEVASAEISLGDLMQAESGSVIELDKMAGEALDVRVNGRLLARGEVVVVNGKYGLRLVEVLDAGMLSNLEH
ncbi:lateral flagellar motor switch protein LfiN [Aeromonas simiae]|uniref:Flagellar motor switch protein FliN n=1 Tax=Aeromonas simiae TaxID=218936 RepID=A0A5J6WXH9_9GAMM|nr:lateral flagellar motor switch protein LfiN [Aeromonas simiae]MDO2948341.1 lateral flagellar motor switch protein LfiN [Aeromonas simiae]MDO2955724.1 lateral flagellar motor switch protein LfiN [Aeromonas simiae]QFI55899.1 flagellar motor switch protein FliN [Aeromonas simiae]